MAAQSLFVSSVMDEETISQALLYSEGLYDLLPTYIETEEEKLKTDLVHKYSKKSAQMDIFPKCIEEGLDSKTQIGGYGEYIPTNILRLSLQIDTCASISAENCYLIIFL